MSVKRRSLVIGTLAAAFAGALALPAGASTVAYYTFENGTNGASVTTAADSSATPTDLSSWGSPLATYSSNVPVAIIPQTGAADTLSAHINGTKGNDFYDLNASTSVLGAFHPANFTIETWVSFDSLSNNFQTFISRDDTGNPGVGAGPQALFYLSVAATGAGGEFRVELMNASNVDVQVNSSVIPVANTWYHVAAVGDATAGTLSLYVNGTLVGSATGYNGLLNASTAWDLGRGQYKGGVADRMNGSIDNVRFSDVALAPSQFLNALAVPEPASMGLLALGGLAIVRRRR